MSNTNRDQFVRERISSLRLKKGVSEYQMSFDLGHSKSYINNITSGKALPSMAEFFAICDYFSIGPIEFFDANVSDPAEFLKITDELKTLDDDDLCLVLRLIHRLRNE